MMQAQSTGIAEFQYLTGYSIHLYSGMWKSWWWNGLGLFAPTGLCAHFPDFGEFPLAEAFGACISAFEATETAKRNGGGVLTGGGWRRGIRRVADDFGGKGVQVELEVA